MQALLSTEAILVESYVGPGEERSLADDVLDGLTRPFKELPPKHFYDAAGAELFDRMCELPEYYPTRAPGSRRRFLRALGRLLRPGVDHLLLGIDLVKDPAIIEAAYDDSAGVTAEFNRNVLRVINRELDADFDVGAFEHVAFFDSEREFTEDRLQGDLAAAGLRLREVLTDPDGLFALSLSSPR
jgi:uncharacterized SAM-dependent methyltransferase